MASRFEVIQRMSKLWLRITPIAIKINHAKQIILIHLNSNSNHFTLSDNSNNVYEQFVSPVSYKNKSITITKYPDHLIIFWPVALIHVNCFRRNYYDVILELYVNSNSHLSSIPSNQ